MSMDLKEMQQIELGIMKVVHQLCEKHKLTYYLGFGTMLGAVRHGGFIPWDDDIDIMMPREDYERFLKIAATELESPFKLKCPGNTKPYLYDFAKVEDTRTKIVETVYSYVDTDNCIYIDIFPLDGCPSSALLRKLHLKHVELWQQLLAMYYSDSDKPRSAWKNVIIKFVKKHFHQDVLNQHIQKLMKKYPFSSSPYAGYYEGKIHELVPKNFWGTPARIKFEEEAFWGVEKAEEYLTALYGDYMKLPPEDERGGHTHSLVEYR